MTRTEIFDVAMPDGTVINAEVLVADSITDVGIRDQLHLSGAKDAIESFVRWAVSSLGFPAIGTADHAEPGSCPPGMTLDRLGLEFGLKLAVRSGALTSVIASAGGEATAVVRLEWQRAPTGEVAISGR